MKNQIIFCAILLSFGLTSTVNASLISNGDFESPLGASNGGGSGGLGPFSSFTAGNLGVPNWIIGTGGIDVFTAYAGTSNAVIDLNRLTGGDLSQTFSTVAGQTYDVTFDLRAALASRSMNVDILGQDGLSAIKTESYTGFSTGSSFVLQNFSFLADGTQATIKFIGLNSGFDGSYIDNVAVQAAVVPVPAAAWLFGSGLLGLVGLARRKA